MTEQQKRKILAVDDNLTNLALLKAHLKHSGLEVQLADNGRAGIEIARNERPDLILLDIMMPEMDGYEVCRILKEDVRTASIPVIFLSAKDSCEDKIIGLKLGAVDYIAKPFDPGELKARIEIVLQMLALQKKLLDRANTDELTGLANRRYFMEALDREVLQTKVKGTSLTVAMLDIDHFKNVNDTYGHLGGDIVLTKLAGILRENLYPLDIPARYGGEEFIVIMPETPIEKALQAAEKIRSRMQSFSWNISTEPVKISASFGLSTTVPANQLDSYDLIKMADTALYSAKRRGRDCVVCWEQVDPNEELELHKSDNVVELQGEISVLSGKLRRQVIGSVSALFEAMSAKDKFTADHAENVRIYAQAITQEMQLSAELAEQVDTSALLHDVGKIGIPIEILRKTTTLNDQEILAIRRHPAISVQIVSPLGIFERELKIIMHHHENFDGSGYPDGLRGEKIPFGARILSVANVYDALTSDRQHRVGRSSEDALAEIADCAGTQFDPEIVDVFLKVAGVHASQWPLSGKKLPAQSVLL